MVPRPVPGGGSRLSLEKARTERVAGGGPPPPFFHGPLVPTRSFWRLCRIVPVVGLFRCPCTCPDLGTFFRKNALQHIFFENASQIGFRISGEIVPLSYQGQRSPKRANGSERAMNPGVQGRSPGPLSPHFSGEMGTPAGQAGQRGAAPQGRLRSRPPQGYAAPGCPWQVVRFGIFAG